MQQRRDGRCDGRQCRGLDGEHDDVDGIDLAGCTGTAAMELERSAAGSLKRVLRAPAEEPDWTADPGLSRMTPFLETKTVWHPIGV